MRLIKLLIALVVIHLGLGFTQMVVSYYAGDVANYGASGWVSHTPIGTFMDLEDADPEDANPEDAPQGLLGVANNLGDMVNGLASFNYGFLSNIQPSDGIVYAVVMAFRIMSALFWLALALALLYLLFDSGLLRTVTGQIATGTVAAGAGIVSGIGAVLP